MIITSVFFKTTVVSGFFKSALFLFYAAFSELLFVFLSIIDSDNSIFCQGGATKCQILNPQ